LLQFNPCYAIKIKKDLHNHILVSLFVVGDWVNMGFCNSLPHHPCNRFQISIDLGFITWFLIFISYLVTFWLLTSA
ncbi:hypothetical protein MKW94_022712, partial [Papaver nudicaule]|nr:hypothetical protein [Papaver nudicaule]